MRKFNFHWRGLTMQLFFLLVLPLTAIGLLVILVSLNLHESAMRSLVGERDQLAISAAAKALSEQLAHRATALQSLAIRAGEAVDPDELLASSEFLQDDFDAGLAIFSRDGELLASTVQLDPHLLQNNGLQSLFLQPLETPSFLQVRVSSDRNAFLLLSVAARDFQSPIVVGMSSLDFASQTMESFFSSSASSFALFDEHGETLLESGEAQVEQRDASIALALAGKTGSNFINIGGNETVVAFTNVTPIGWALLMTEPWESISNPLLRSTQFAPLLLIPVVLFALLALWFEARQIVQPLQKLERQAAELSWGNYKMINTPVGGIEEVKRLQKELVHLSEKVQKSQFGLRSYIGAITEGQEEERRRLSNELHDDTIQSLIALNQRIQLAQMTAEPGLKSNLAEVQTLVDQTLGNLRRLIRDLRPIYLEDLGLSAALDVLCREATQNYKFPITFQLLGKERRLAPDVELAFYRIAQEGLSNMGRHANAKHGWVTLDFSVEKVDLILRDDGKGFLAPESPAEFAPGGHFGLLGIHEKAERLGAKLMINTGRNKGTELKITLGS
jgi:signal transduction histidine kinase